jgi:hypothetical protein
MTPRRALALALVLVAAAWAVPLPARPSPDLVVTAPPGLAAVAGEVEAIGRGDFTGGLVITGLLGFTSPIRVELVEEDGPVARRTPSWVSGFADGRRRSIVLIPSRVSRYPDTSLATLVHHEVAHVLVAEAARGRPVPRWFDEGVATVAAREWGLEDRARYAVAVVGRGPRTAAELDRGFAEGGRGVVRSYALAGAFVRWLRHTYGAPVTARILELVGDGRPFDEAFVRATGDTLGRAEHRFFVRQALWHTWVPFLTSSGVLWAAITALAVVAIGRRRARSAAMRQRWLEEEEERLLPGRPGTVDPGDDEVVN